MNPKTNHTVAVPIRIRKCRFKGILIRPEGLHTLS